MQQTWSYDWIGNTDTSTDDASLFYDRSLGAITNTGYRLTSASQPKLTATYDAAGYMTSMTVLRDGTCVPAALCATQTFQYRWDEVGRLVDATRQDASGPGAHLEYAYDASDNRVRKTVVSGEDSRHTVYVFGSLELRLAEFTGTEYAVDDSTEVPYLFGHGVRLARVTYTDAADFQTERRRIFLELGDHLGSTSVVLDHATGELVERSTAFAYGSAESNYRTQRWDHFREDYRFTGKEDDIEVGLIYFGARYLNPQLGRWISADPLAVHAPGKADLNLYAYVHGKVLVAVVPVGLESVTDWLREVSRLLGGGHTLRPTTPVRPAPQSVQIINQLNDQDRAANAGMMFNAEVTQYAIMAADSVQAGADLSSLAAYGIVRLGQQLPRLPSAAPRLVELMNPIFTGLAARYGEYAKRMVTREATAVLIGKVGNKTVTLIATANKRVFDELSKLTG